MTTPMPPHPLPPPSPAPETVAIATIAALSARIARGSALPPDEAEHIVKAVVRMLGESADIEHTRNNEE